MVAGFMVAGSMVVFIDVWSKLIIPLVSGRRLEDKRRPLRGLSRAATGTADIVSVPGLTVEALIKRRWRFLETSVKH